MPKRFDSRKFREIHGMKDQQEMADRVGVDKRAVQHWDAGTRTPGRLARQRFKQLDDERKAKQQPTASDEPPDSTGPSSGPVRHGFGPSFR